MFDCLFVGSVVLLFCCCVDVLVVCLFVWLIDCVFVWLIGWLVVCLFVCFWLFCVGLAGCVLVCVLDCSLA